MLQAGTMNSLRTEFGYGQQKNGRKAVEMEYMYR